MKLQENEQINPVAKTIAVFSSLTGALFAGAAMSFITSSVKTAFLVACAVLLVEVLLWSYLLRKK